MFRLSPTQYFGCFLASHSIFSFCSTLYLDLFLLNILITFFFVRGKPYPICVWSFCPRPQCSLVPPPLIGPDLYRPYPGTLFFPFPVLDIYTECEPTFLFLHHITCIWGFSPIPSYATCTIGCCTSLEAQQTACSASCSACLWTGNTCWLVLPSIFCQLHTYHRFSIQPVSFCRSDF